MDNLISPLWKMTVVVVPSWLVCVLWVNFIRKTYTLYHLSYINANTTRKMAAFTLFPLILLQRKTNDEREKRRDDKTAFTSIYYNGIVHILCYICMFIHLLYSIRFCIIIFNMTLCIHFLLFLLHNIMGRRKYAYVNTHFG